MYLFTVRNDRAQNALSGDVMRRTKRCNLLKFVNFFFYSSSQTHACTFAPKSACVCWHAKYLARRGIDTLFYSNSLYTYFNIII